MEIKSYADFIGERTEFVTAISVSNGSITALADIEYWEDCLEEYFNEPYRIELFTRDTKGREWILNEELEAGKTLTEALSLKAGKLCGGKYFKYESSRSAFNVNEALCHLLSACSPEIIAIDSHNAKALLSLKDGYYIVIER